MRIILTIIFCLFTSLSWAVDDCGDGDGNTWCIETTDTTVDGSTICGGACTSADTITIDGGAIDHALVLQNFDGNGSYITIQNDASTRVVITGNGAGDGNGVLAIDNCKYIDIRGDNLAGTTYGIKVINNYNRAGSVWVKSQSDHIKLSYLEVTCEGSTTETGNGIFFQDGTEASTWTWDTVEIHHNYIHDTRYHGMYLGQNDPGVNDNPWTKNFSIHDNILTDIGANGFVYKGVATGGTELMYNNYIDNTGLVFTGGSPGPDEWWCGIRWRPYTTATASIYGNTVTNTKGPAIVSGLGAAAIYNNICAKNGTTTNDPINWGHGILTYLGANGTTIYDNIIIQSNRYGFYNKGSATGGVTLSRNLIGDAGVGEWAEASIGDTVVSASPNANIYHADVASFNFDTWSDDSDYTNDVFGGRGLNPTNGADDVATTVTLSGTLFTGVSTVDMYYECATPPSALVVDNGVAISYDPTPDPSASATCYWQNIYTHGWGTETGAIYSFTVTGPANPPTPPGSVQFLKSGSAFEYLKKGGTLQ